MRNETINQDRHHLWFWSVVVCVLFPWVGAGCANLVKDGAAVHDRDGGAVVTEKAGPQQQSESRGGESRSTAQAVSVDVSASGVKVTMGQQLQATTQPATRTQTLGATERSATTQPSEHWESHQPTVSGYGAMPKLAGADAGEVAGVSFQQMKEGLKSNWPLFGIFLAAAGFCWYVYRSIVWTAGCIGMALLAVLEPQWLGYLAMAAVLGVLVLNWKTISQLVQGADKALQASTNADSLKALMSTKQDAATKAAVRAVKGKA